MGESPFLGTLNVMTMHRIVTERLLLTPYEAGDLDELHALWCSPGVRRFLFDDELIPLEFVRDELASNARQFETHGWGQWKAMSRNEDRLIGFCGFREFHEPPELELLFGLDESVWGQGLAVEMARTLIGLGFRRWGFERIQGSTDAPNRASIRVMEKLGMKQCRREMTNGLDTVYFETTPLTFDATGLSLTYDGEYLDFGK